MAHHRSVSVLEYFCLRNAEPGAGGQAFISECQYRHAQLAGLNSRQPCSCRAGRRPEVRPLQPGECVWDPMRVSSRR